MKNSGYEDIALLSLSTADYTCVEQLMGQLLLDHAASGVGVSLPSLRVDAFSVGLAARTQEVRKSGITLAPEAGSARMRDVINKGVTEQDILSAASAAFSQGYTHIKLYFMLGLPYETDSDIIGIAEICRKILQLGRQNKPAEVKKPLRMSLGVASFIPKSHTPFQWQGQNTEAQLKRKQELLREHIRPMRQITLNVHDRQASLYEAAFARGDRRLCPVLVEAYRRGCMFDGWTEHFKPQVWRESFAAFGLTPEEFAEREIVYGEALPWSHISCGVSEEWLWQENLRAARAELTEDCSRGACTDCGVCGQDCGPGILPKATENPAKFRRPQQGNDGEPHKYRCKLSIGGSAAWLSHLDVLAMMEKALRRSALPMAYSQGFNPHMQISWGPAHPVGLYSESEYVDLLLTARPKPDWEARFNEILPPSVRLLAAKEIPAETPALMATVNQAAYELVLEEPIDLTQLDQKIAAFLAASSILIERVSPKGKKQVDVRPSVEKLYREGHTLHVLLWLDRGAAIKMPELSQLLLPGEAPLPARRTAMFMQDKQGRREPL